MIAFLASLCLALSALYALFFYLLRQHWRLAVQTDQPAPPDRFPLVSVLIPFRNEADHLDACLEGLLQQTYPKGRLELIAINDHSTDHSATIVESYVPAGMRLYQLTETAGKKAALATGIKNANGTLLITTDADCTHPPKWIERLVAHHLKAPDALLTAPVLIQSATGFCDRFQGLELAGYLLLNGGMAHWGIPILANGANMAFPRSLYQKVGGYGASAARSSGDDILFLQRVQALTTASIRFIPELPAAVSTPAEPSWQQLIVQRLRWASKRDSYTDWRLHVLQGGIWLFCLLLLICLASTLPYLMAAGGTAWLIKAEADRRTLQAGSAFAKHPGWMTSYWQSQLLQPVYLVLIGTLSLLHVRVSWKGRPVR